MGEEERTAACRNCGRNQPLSALNKEGRCETCGSSETVSDAPDPSEVGPHGLASKKADEEPEEGGEKPEEGGQE